MQFYIRQKNINQIIIKLIIMKTYLNRALLLMVVLFTVSSCEVIGDIFQAGMGVGIFLVIAVVVLVIWLINKFRK